MIREIERDMELAKSVGLEKPKQSFIHRLATGICTVWNDNPKALLSGGGSWFTTLNNNRK